MIKQIQIIVWLELPLFPAKIESAVLKESNDMKKFNKNVNKNAAIYLQGNIHFLRKPR